jgi:hypothetical protein
MAYAMLEQQNPMHALYYARLLAQLGERRVCVRTLTRIFRADILVGTILAHVRADCARSHRRVGWAT